MEKTRKDVVAALESVVPESLGDAVLYRAMLDNVPVNIMVTGPDLRIRYINPAAANTLRSRERVLGLKANQLLGQSLVLFYPDREQQGRIAGDPRNLPRKAQSQLGAETLDLAAAPMYDAKGEFLGSIVVLEVSTDKAALSARLRGGMKNFQEIAEMGGSLVAVSEGMRELSEQNSDRANQISAVSEETSRGIQTVAAAAEELSISIREISKNVQESNRLTASSVALAQEANAVISQLGEASSDIGKVVKLITSIAQQTNLLALNATIEAARAGDAGRGFAVVASEVKELAKETARATEDISAKIEGIQRGTNQAVSSIGKIGGAIDQVNEISLIISSAVEEQSVTTQEITRNMAEAASGASEVVKNVAMMVDYLADTTKQTQLLKACGGSRETQAEEVLALFDDLLAQG